MSDNYTNQHTVPKCYLRRFAFGKNRNPHVYVYDKTPAKQRIAATKDICYEQDIYTLSEFSEEGMSISEEERKQYYETNYLKNQVEDLFQYGLMKKIIKVFILMRKMIIQPRKMKQ